MECFFARQRKVYHQEPPAGLVRQRGEPSFSRRDRRGQGATATMGDPGDPREGPIHVRSHSRVLWLLQTDRSIFSIATTDSRIYWGLADDQPGTPVRVSLIFFGRSSH